jgi:hypothetical protein
LLVNRMLQIVFLSILYLLSGNLFSSLAQSQGPYDLRPPAREKASPPAAGGATETARNEFAVWGGGSFLTAGISGTTRDVKLGIVGLRYARVLSSGRVAVLKYTADAIPFAMLSYLKKREAQTASGPSIVRTHPTVYGLGAAPLGLQVNFRPRHRLQPYANFSGGCLFFADTVPSEVGKQFNFTAEAGVGLQILASSHRAVSLGYKLHHISNAGRSNVNPGFGSNLFYLGYSWFK